MAPWPRTSFLLLGVLALALPRWVAAEAAEEPDTLRFARAGAPVAARSLAQLRAAATAATVRVHEPYEAREVTFEALDFRAVLDHVYGKAWRSEEELLFTCRDGYQPTVPVARVLRHRAWLAFARAEADFTIEKHESGARRRVELGPFYLIWENREDEQVRLEGDYGWPYQLVGVDLIRRSERFPRMAPPEGASAGVTAGFDAFRVHCSKCHKLNGEGGDLGPELNAAASPLAYRERDWLRTWIVDPSRIRPNTRMPALNPKLPDRDGIADAILLYLEAMAAAGNGAP